MLLPRGDVLRIAQRLPLAIIAPLALTRLNCNFLCKSYVEIYSGLYSFSVRDC